jgi:hypothetical protein
VRAADLGELGRVAANREVLAIIETMADRRTGRSSSPWDIDDFVLHSHPDLSERMEEAAGGLPGGGRYVGVRGHAALIDPDRVIRVVAIGMSGLAIRIRDEGIRADIARHSRFTWTGFGPDWVGADAWPVDLSLEDGTARLRGWLAATFAEAAGPDLGSAAGGR